MNFYIIVAQTVRVYSSSPNGGLIVEVSLYRKAYCGPNGVFTMEVSLYVQDSLHFGPNGALIIEVSP